MNLSPEQMEFLANKGLSTSDIISFARIEAARSSGAKRQARYRARQKAAAEESDVTRDITDGDVPPPSLSPNEYISNPHTHPPETQTPARARPDDFPCPDWADAEVWRDLKRNRKTKKLTNTPTAHKRFIAAVEGMADDDWPPGKLIEEIVAKGWGGPHDPRGDRKQQNDRPAYQKPDNRDGVAKALDRRLGLDQPAGPNRRSDFGEAQTGGGTTITRLAAN